MTSTTRQRLDAAIRAVAPIHGTSGEQGAVRIDYNGATAPQIAAGDAVLASFDFSQAADDTWLVSQARAAGKALYARTTDYIAKVLRAIVGLTLDEINVLRAQTIGVGTLTWDPASMANGTGATSPNITVTGAAFGDICSPAAPYTLAGVTATAYVSAANTVNIRLENQTGAAANLASGNWSVVVERKTVLAPRTTAQAKTAIDNKVDAD